MRCLAQSLSALVARHLLAALDNALPPFPSGPKSSRPQDLLLPNLPLRLTGTPSRYVIIYLNVHPAPWRSNPVLVHPSSPRDGHGRSARRLILLAAILGSLLPATSATAELALVGPGLELTAVTGFLHTPEVAFLPDGSFFIAWDRLEGCSAGSCTDSLLLGRLYDPEGEPRGDEFEISIDRSVANGQPRVAVSPGGTIAVLWTSDPEGAEARQVLELRFYSPEGTPLGDVVTIRPRVPDEYLLDTAMAAMPNGDFFVVWSSFWFFDLIEGQRFSETGTRRGKRFLISTRGEQVEKPAISVNETGQVLVTWQRQDVFFAGERSIQARRFTQKAKPLGEDFTVNSERRGLAYFYREPSLVLDDDGEATVVWTMSRHTSNQGVRLQRLNADGRPIGGEVQVDESPGFVSNDPLVALLSGKRQIVVWQRADDADSETGHEIYARLIAADGQPSGDELTVNGAFPIGEEQHSPAVAVGPDGQVLVIWIHEQEPGGPRRVRGQFVSPDAASASVRSSRHRTRRGTPRLPGGGS